MKKLISSKKIVAVLLCFAMLLPMCVIGTTAATTKISYTNLFTGGRQGHSTLDNNLSYWASDFIKVSEGDEIYVGPILLDQGFHITAFNVDTLTELPTDGDWESSNILTGYAQVALSGDAIVDVFEVGNVGIAKWTVPAGAKSIVVVASQMFADMTLVTNGQSFDVQSYLDYAVGQGKNVDYLKPTSTAEALNNVFPKSDSVSMGYITQNGTERFNTKKNGEWVVTTANDWWKCATSDYISVTQGDTLYFTGYVPGYFGDQDNDNYHLALCDADKNYITNQSNSTSNPSTGVNWVNSDFLIEYENLGRDYMIYAYHIGRSDVKYVRVIASRGMYDDGLELVTKNQPFTGKQYRKLMGLPESIVSRVDPRDESSPLNGKRALFLGDSITEGFRDMYSYGRNGLSWAGRINRDTGLDFVNPALHGSTISHLNIGESSGNHTADTDNQGWGWIYNQYEANAASYFDMVVMHGGVNDARYSRAYGEVERINLYDIDSFNESTFAGGLQKLFASVKSNYPEATLFYIVNFRLDNAKIKYGDTTKTLETNGHLGNYFYLAREICELYDIHLIDLYRNQELTTALETNKTTYLEDMLHPSPEGYEIITPFIIQEMESVISANSFGVDSLNDPLDGVSVGGTGSSTSIPTVPSSLGYSVWDGTTYDTDWESAGDKAYYITSAAELAGLKKKIDDAAVSNRAAWIAAADAAEAANKAVPGYNGVAGYSIHQYSGYTFYVTVNIDLAGKPWDGLGTHDQMAIFQGTIVGDANKNAAYDGSSDMVYIKGLNAVYNEDKFNVPKSTNGTTSGSSSEAQGVGLITIQSGGGLKHLTLVDPKATVSIVNTGFFVGRSRTSQVSYEDLHVVNGTMVLSTAHNYIGGFLGQANSSATIKNSSISGTFNLVNGTAAPANIGGLIGGATAGDQVIQNCTADVDFIHYGGNSKHVGGILGNTSTTGTIKIKNCSYVGGLRLSANSESFMAGGILGSTTQTKGNANAPGLLIEQCKADFTVNVGVVAGKIAGVFAGGSIGIVSGESEGYITIRHCFANVHFNVASRGDEQLLCGITCYNSGRSFLNIENCSSSGNITVTGNKTFTRVSGILGVAKGGGNKITNCISSVHIDSQLTKDSGTSPTKPTPPDANATVAKFKEYYASEAYITWANWYKSNTNAVDAYDIGGILGCNLVNGTEIANCVFTGTIEASRKGGVLRYVGGILGSNMQIETKENLATYVHYSVSIRNCMATCKILTADSGSFNNDVHFDPSTQEPAVQIGGRIGGIAGYIGGEDCIVTKCSASVTFDFKGEAKNVSGIITNAKTNEEENKVISYSANFCNIGGIIGLLNGTLAESLADCVAQGMISLQDGQLYSGSHLYQSGGLIGRNNGNLTIENAKVTFVIRDTSTTTSNDTSDTIAGVIGFADHQADIVGAKVTFRHFLTTPYDNYLTHYGGVIGRTDANAAHTIQDCVVDYELHAEKAMYDIDGVGAIIGTVTNGTITVDNCYTTGIINNAKYAGGIFGRIYSKGTTTIKNTQAEVIVNGNATQCGGFIGRLDGPLDLKNCLFTGLSCQSYAGYYAFGWIGLLSSARNSATDAITIENCYSNNNFPVFPSMDSPAGSFTGQIKLNDSMYPATEPTTYYRGELINAPTGIQDCKNLSGDGWTTYTDGTNPIRTIAKDVQRTYGKADLHWFKPVEDITRTVTNNNETFTVNKTGYHFTNAPQAIGLAMISHLKAFYNDIHPTAKNLTIDRDCFVIDRSTGNDYTLLIDHRVNYEILGICAHHRTYPGLEDTSYCTGKVVTFNSLNIYKQYSAATNGNSDYVNIRFLAMVEEDLTGYNTAGFRITNLEVNKTITKSFTTVYKSVQTPSGIETAPDGYYYFAYEIYNVPKDMVMKVEAFVEYKGCAAYGVTETIYVNQLVAAPS